MSPYMVTTARSTDCLANSSLLAQGTRAGSRLMQNPNKAWAIISESGSILVNNSILSSLLGYSDTDLRQLQLWDLIIKRSGDKRQEALEQLDIEAGSGETSAYNGRVVSIRCSDQSQVTVSINVRKLPDSTRYMVYIEPVSRTVGFIDVNRDGVVTDVDSDCEAIFQCRGSDVVGVHLESLVTSVQWPGEEAGSVSRFSSTGQTDVGSHFPVSCVVTRLEEGGCRAGVWVYSTLSGLIILDQAAAVTRCDESFVSLVLGYTSDQLTGVSIEKIIPGFYDEFDVPSDDKTDDDLGCEDLARSCDNIDQLARSGANTPVSPLEEISINIQSISLSSPSVKPGSPLVFKHPQAPSSVKENVEESPVFKRPNTLSVKTPVKVPMELLTSTPASCSRKTRRRSEMSLDRSRHRPRHSVQDQLDSPVMPSGCFYGLGRHRCGGEVSVLYQVKKIILKTGEIIYCVWITRDAEEAAKNHAQLTLASTVHDSSDTNATHGDDDKEDESQDVTDNKDYNLQETEEDANLDDPSVDVLTSGDYRHHYVTLNQIGKGAFGCVYSAYRSSDKRLVVTKFIRKSKVSYDMWVDSGSSAEKIPFEASLLISLQHPGLVTVLDVYQNRNFVQMVMEKHGEMDLFEFIDRNPLMDEPLASIIFKQIVEAVDYLHSREILHRDIKDENIIIDHKFRCKLIDFGSATFFKPGQLFNTFYGTVEYCSPEVLQGCAYEGPALEMWSLGVLLYIILFGENPFYNAEDTMKAELHPPHSDVSPHCWELIQSCLESDPRKRASLWYIKEHDWVNTEASADDYSFADVVPCNQSEISPATHYEVSFNNLRCLTLLVSSLTYLI